MIHERMPPRYRTNVDTVGCHLERGGELLILLRPPNNKIEPRKWGSPAGKMEDTDKDAYDAMVREIAEETGIQVARTDLT